MSKTKHSILLTGGAGYCGSHTYAALAEAGYPCVIIDDFSNSRPEVIARLEKLTGAPVTVVQADVRDEAALARLFAEHSIGGVIHFAAKKAVGESVEKPLEYFASNIGGLGALLQAMKDAGVFRLVFSSSCTVYGLPETLPMAEDAPRGYNSPYGFTKLVCEQMLEQVAASDSRWRMGILRYFNPVGAHPSGLIGEDPAGIPDNLMPRLALLAAQVVKGAAAEPFKVFGGDYNTADGTAIRDYIHVSDLAVGHVQCLAALTENDAPSVLTLNLGTGQGHSVLDVIKAYNAACGYDLPYEIVARRPGDVPVTYADASRAQKSIGFSTRYSLDDMCQSSWNWIKDHA